MNIMHALNRGWVGLAIAVIGLGSLIGYAWAQGGDTASNNNSVGSADVRSAIEALREAKQEFREARQQATEGVANRTANVQAEQIQHRQERRRTVLQRLLNVYAKHLERTRDRINRMPNITADDQAAAVAKIDEALAAVTDLQSQVTAAATDEALKGLAEKIREQLRSYHILVRAAVDALHASRITKFIATAEERAADLALQLDDLAAAGRDVTVMQARLGDADGYLDEAAIQSANHDFRAALQSIKDAYAEFRAVLQGIHALTNINS